MASLKKKQKKGTLIKYFHGNTQKKKVALISDTKSYKDTIKKQKKNKPLFFFFFSDIEQKKASEGCSKR